MKGKPYKPSTKITWYSIRSCFLFCEFRYASVIDRLWTFVGLTSATLAGLCVPAIVILFGKLAEEFINFEVVKVYEEHVQWKRRADLAPAGLKWSRAGNSSYLTKSLISVTTDLALFTIVLGLSQLLLGALFTATLNRSAGKQVLKAQTQYLFTILRQDMSWLDVHNPRDLSLNIIRLMNNIYEGLAEKLGVLVYTSVATVAGFAIAFTYGWLLSLMLVTVVPIVFLISFIGMKIRKYIKSVQRQSYIKPELLACDSLLNIRSVAAYQGYSEENKIYARSLVLNETMSTGLHTFRGLVAGILWFLIYCTYALALHYGMNLALDDNYPAYSPPTLITIFFGVQIGLMNLLQIPSYMKIMHRAKKSAEEVFAVIDRKPTMDRCPEDVKEPLDFLPSVTFTNVHFSYPSRPDIEVLRGVSFTIPAGQLVAVTGRSGSGKSTCLQLMDGLYDPSEGTVRLSGVDSRQVSGDWLRSRVGFVQQQTTLLGTTIGESIRFGTVALDADVTDAAKIAGAHDTIEQLPKKYATQLGVGLSDELKQRLAIARALLRNTDILLLDDCFSYMSGDAENDLLAAIMEERPGCTLVVVSARQRTLEVASHVIVLAGGVAVEQGPFTELLRERQWLYEAVRRADAARDVGAMDVPDDDIIDEFEAAAVELGRRNVRSCPRPRCVSSDGACEAVSIVTALGRTAVADDDGEWRWPEWSSVLRLNAREWPLLATASVAAALSGLSLPVYAALFGECLAIISVNPTSAVTRRLDFYSKLFIIAGCLSGAALIVQGYTLAAAGSRLTRRLRQKAFNSMLHQEMAWFDRADNDVRSLLRLLRVDTANVQKASGEQLSLVVQLGCVVWVSALLALYYNWRLGALAVALAPLQLCALLHLARTVSRRPLQELGHFDRVQAMTREALTLSPVLVAGCAQPLVLSQLSAELSAAHAALARAARFRPLVFGLALATPAFCYSAMAALGAHLFNNGLVSFEDLFKVVQSLMLGTLLVSQLVALAPDVWRGQVAAGRVVRLISRRPLIYNPTTEFHAKWKMSGNIRFYKVSYRPGPPQLRDFSLQLREGQSVALVGAPGCGRSLPVPLLLRFYSPSAGTLLLDGRDIAIASLNTLRSQMALADFDAIFFRRKVADNISYGSWGASMDEIITAAKEAGAHDFITALPEGYSTILDESTVLTPSQRLRLSLARAVLRDSPVLLVENLRKAENDDAEALVDAALRRACVGRTCVLSCEQPQCAAVRAAQWVCVMRAGAIAEQGPVAFLAASQSLYRRLSQSSSAD